MKAKNISKRRLSSIKDLKEHDLIDRAHNPAYEQIETTYAIGLSDHLVTTIKSNSQSQALRKQYIPDIRELETANDEIGDPIGDKAHEPVKGIVHRYPDRVLFKIANVCAVYCRYCFRREMIGPGSDALSADDTDQALDYIRENQNIWEVILTGGDPLVLSPRKLEKTLKALNEIEHVRVVRIHTRIPIADPKRVTEDLLESFKTLSSKALYIVLHINHSDEITNQVKEKVKQIHNTGCTLLSQSVLLKDINDDASVLDKLFRELISINVKPYYLHHPDKAKGTKHFRLSLKQGMGIYQSLLGRLSGICQPSYMLDIPGGYGKIPINLSYVEEIGNGRYYIKDYQGNTHLYADE